MSRPYLTTVNAVRLFFLICGLAVWGHSGAVAAAASGLAAPPLTRSDSLWIIYHDHSRSAINRVRALMGIEYELADAYPDSARRISNMALSLSRRAGYPYGEIQALNALSMSATRRADSQAAMRYLTAAVARARATGERRGLSTSYDRLADVAFGQQDFTRAAQLAQQALVVAAELGEPPPSSALSSLMSSYLELGRIDEARPLFRRVLKQARRDPHDGALMEFQALAAWANGMRRLAPDTAIRYGEHALRLAERLGNKPALTYAQLVLVQTYATRKRWPAIRALAPQALALLKDYPNPAYEAEIQLAYGDALHALQPASPAAYVAVRRALVLNDTLFGQEQSAALAAAQVKFDVAGQQARIRELEQQRSIQQLRGERQRTRTRQLIAVAVALSTLLLVGAWFYRRLRAQRAALAVSEGRLRQANATKDQLMAIVGHDLRGPAAALGVVAPLLRSLGVETADPSGEVKEVLTGLDASTQELSSLLDTLLQWAREQTGVLRVRPQTVAAAAVVTAALAPYKAQAALANVRLERQPVAPDVALHTDPDLLATVLRNLIANAVKFSAAGGAVRVGAENSPGPQGQPGVLFTVADAGRGLEAARFARLCAAGGGTAAPATDAPLHVDGTGLGLPLSTRFATLLGGELRLLASSAAGSRIGCWLPVGSST